MDFALFFAILAAMPAYSASLACRWVESRHRKARWHIGILSAMAGGLLMTISMYQGELFHPFAWGDDKIWIPMVFLVASVISLGPALLTVWYYRKRFRHLDHVA
jgi:sugar phosphate permease